MKRIVFTPILLILAFLTMPILPVSATIPLPDSAASLVAGTTHANRNLIDTGDLLIYAEYNIPYTSPPTTPVSQTFIWRLIDTDNVTELGAVLAYPYTDYGYNSGVVAFYFPTGLAPMWGQNYSIRLDGNPAEFVSPPSYIFSMDTGSWSIYLDRTNNRTELKSRILTFALDLDAVWGLSGTNKLLQQTDTGTVLSENGAAYFNYAIYGLQSMCPDLYFAVINTISWSSVNRTYTPTLPNLYANRLTGSWPAVAVTAIGGMFGVSYSTSGSLIVVLGLGLLVIVGSLVSGSALSGFMAGLVWVICGMLLGWFPVAAMFIASLFCIFYLGALTIGKLIP